MLPGLADPGSRSEEKGSPESSSLHVKNHPKFNGVPRKTFLLHLKECEFRFNHRAEDLSDKILTLLKETPL